LGRSVWAEKSTTESDLATLGTGLAGVLIAYDAPVDFPTLDTWLAATDRGWPPAGLRYSAEGRTMFHRGFLQVQPRLYLGGHYHRHIDEPATYTTRETEFQIRVVILDESGSTSGTSQAVLNEQTLELENITRDAARAQTNTSEQSPARRTPPMSNNHRHPCDSPLRPSCLPMISMTLSSQVPSNSSRG
jgi:hypothetical protein